MSLTPGTRFGSYEILGAGGMGEVYRARDARLGREVALKLLPAALAAAHAKGVVHRDLKPANVMLARDGRVKVLDFGLAKLTEVSAAMAETRTLAMAEPISVAGQVVGTVPYMAPEQLRGEATDARTDLFALGIILYELATGRRPFGGATSAAVSSAILRNPPAPLASLRAELPADLGRIVDRCLEKDPERRLQSAKDLRNELELLRRSLESRPTAAAATATAAAPPADQPSIAVLPFVNRSRDEEDEYFADGLADELLNTLAKIRGLRAAARSSAFTFKGKEATVAEVGQALKMATVLEGSVRKAGGRVRIAVQLVKVADGYQLWSETYDRTLEVIFAAQARAAVNRALAFKPDLVEGHLALGSLQAGYDWDWPAADASYRRALTLAPNQAEVLRAAAAMARDLGRLDESLALAQRAIEQDPLSAGGYSGLASSFRVLGRWAEAEAAFRRVLELSPQRVGTHMVLSNVLFYQGRLEEALSEAARENDEWAWLTAETVALHALGRHEEAERALARLIGAYGGTPPTRSPASTRCTARPTPPFTGSSAPTSSATRVSRCSSASPPSRRSTPTRAGRLSWPRWGWRTRRTAHRARGAAAGGRQRRAAAARQPLRAELYSGRSDPLFQGDGLRGRWSDGLSLEPGGRLDRHYPVRNRWIAPAMGRSLHGQCDARIDAHPARPTRGRLPLLVADHSVR